MVTAPFTDGSDDVSLGNGIDIADAGNGNDKVEGNGGDDTIRGQAGDDILSGGAGRDILAGGIGSDILSGGAGSDILSGGAGKDTLSGGTGSDDLTGGEGVDTLKGGEGRDKFNFQASDGAASKDVVVDFENGIDKLVLKGDMSLAGIAEQNGGTMITFDTGASVFLKGVAASDIDSSDFLFQGGADAGGFFL